MKNTITLLAFLVMMSRAMVGMFSQSDMYAVKTDLHNNLMRSHISLLVNFLLVGIMFLYSFRGNFTIDTKGGKKDYTPAMLYLMIILLLIGTSIMINYRKKIIDSSDLVEHLEINEKDNSGELKRLENTQLGLFITACIIGLLQWGYSGFIVGENQPSRFGLILFIKNLLFIIVSLMVKPGILEKFKVSPAFIFNLITITDLYDLIEIMSEHGTEQIMVEKAENMQLPDLMIYKSR